MPAFSEIEVSFGIWSRDLKTIASRTLQVAGHSAYHRLPTTIAFLRYTFLDDTIAHPVTCD